MLNINKVWAAVLVLGLLTTGCATTPEPSDKLIALEYQYKSLVQRGFIEEFAPIALKEASESIAKAEKLEQSNAKKEVVEHQQYLAQLKLDTAVEIANKNRAEAKIENAEVKRSETLLAAKDRKLKAAEIKAEKLTERVTTAEAEAALAKRTANKMTDKANELASTLKEVSVSQSDRGMVLTMGSILFEFNKSTLKPGAERTLERVAEFLAQFPDRNVLVEGFTDSTGLEAYNQSLSEERASSVVAVLSEHGINKSRLTSKGYGEQFPVANNDTDAGRQQNRRVELIIADKAQHSVKTRSE